MRMIPTKKTPEEIKTEMPGAPMQIDEYPWGTRLDLDEDLIARLGMDALPQVGEEFDLAAVVKVCSVSANDSETGGPRRCITLQITAMGLEGAAMDDKRAAAAAALYGEPKK